MKATPTTLGPLATKVQAFIDTMGELVSAAEAPVPDDYWAPLEAFVDAAAFRRYVPEGAFGEGGQSPWEKTVLTWPEYLDLFSMWGASSPSYSNVIERATELPGLVYLEVEEHHGEQLFRSVSAYGFDDAGRITSVRVAAAADAVRVLVD
jgi:hypothetical protein